MQAFVEGTGERFSECHSSTTHLLCTCSVLVPDLGHTDTYEHGLNSQETRGRKCHLHALENRSAVKRVDKKMVRTVQMVVTKQHFAPLFRAQDALRSKHQALSPPSLNVDRHILLPFSPPSDVFDSGSIFVEPL